MLELIALLVAFKLWLISLNNEGKHVSENSELLVKGTVWMKGLDVPGLEHKECAVKFSHLYHFVSHEK